MMQDPQSLAKRSLRWAFASGTAILAVAIAVTAWFGIFQSEQLRCIDEEQAFYRDLVQCRVTLASLDDRLSQPDLSAADSSDIEARLVLERARFAESGRREAIRRGGQVESWLTEGKSGKAKINRESIGLMLIELDTMISASIRKIADSSSSIVSALHLFMVFIGATLFTIVFATGRLMLSNYRHLLVPLNHLANRLTQLNRNIPESIHETAEATSTILSDPDPSPDLRYVTESVAGLCRDIEEKNKKLDELYIRDEKTSLYNYRHFKEHLIIDVERSKRFGDCISLAMVDIDHFKQYNDSYGHIAGDRVLEKMAEIIRGQCRVTDIPSRFGGEEFAILFPKTDRHMSFEIAERLRQIIEAEPFDHEHRQPEGQLTVSIGLATWPDDAADWYSLINNADSALYKAKEQGRNRVIAFSREPGDPEA
ncbi:MAG: GGDEF domain-containing protein [Chlorobiaceae bacterium]|nr:GGDEF domain-containing protein [Chlorobiaceae bacterium]